MRRLLMSVLTVPLVVACTSSSGSSGHLVVPDSIEVSSAPSASTYREQSSSISSDDLSTTPGKTDEDEKLDADYEHSNPVWSDPGIGFAEVGKAVLLFTENPPTVESAIYMGPVVGTRGEDVIRHGSAGIFVLVRLDESGSRWYALVPRGHHGCTEVHSIPVTATETEVRIDVRIGIYADINSCLQPAVTPSAFAFEIPGGLGDRRITRSACDGNIRCVALEGEVLGDFDLVETQLVDCIPGYLLAIDAIAPRNAAELDLCEPDVVTSTFEGFGDPEVWRSAARQPLQPGAAQ